MRRERVCRECRALHEEEYGTARTTVVTEAPARDQRGQGWNAGSCSNRCRWVQADVNSCAVENFVARNREVANECALGEATATPTLSMMLIMSVVGVHARRRVGNPRNVGAMLLDVKRAFCVGEA